MSDAEIPEDKPAEEQQEHEQQDGDAVPNDEVRLVGSRGGL